MGGVSGHAKAGESDHARMEQGVIGLPRFASITATTEIELVPRVKARADREHTQREQREGEPLQEQSNPLIHARLDQHIIGFFKPSEEISVGVLDRRQRAEGKCVPVHDQVSRAYRT